jgi:hypothetical protein
MQVGTWERGLLQPHALRASAAALAFASKNFLEQSFFWFCLFGRGSSTSTPLFEGFLKN